MPCHAGRQADSTLFPFPASSVPSFPFSSLLHCSLVTPLSFLLPPSLPPLSFLLPLPPSSLPPPLPLSFFSCRQRQKKPLGRRPLSLGLLPCRLLPPPIPHHHVPFPMPMLMPSRRRSTTTLHRCRSRHHSQTLGLHPRQSSNRCPHNVPRPLSSPPCQGPCPPPTFTPQQQKALQQTRQQQQ